MNKGLVFKSETHEYFVDGIKYPSVSEIISPLVDLSGVPKANLEKARKYGIALHDTLKFYLKGTLDEEKLDSGLKLPLEGFKKFIKGKKSEIIFYEKPLYHNKLKYAGTPDLLMTDGLYDFKSRPFNPIADPIQLEAYYQLVQITSGYKVEKKLFVLEFDLEGNVRVVNAYRKQAKGIFRTLLDYYYSEIEFNQTLNGWRNNL